ncbi:hypothetical protein SAV14893_084980 [Streptomyces avermitilis]|uniref:Uncharacterized protein n=1 Tax=Streptomyces avermitilis TaxID=33903 RepID=A0A4D4MB71_STRAX|nr:hypothetical protein SAV14893_084980 [Streptomyces avermitilis]
MLVLEGVGGQVEVRVGVGVGVVVGVVVVPGGGCADAGGMGVGEGGEEAAGVVVAAAEAADRGDVFGGVFGGVFDGGDEGGVGADFDEDAVSVIRQGLDGIAETDRLVQVAVPVGGVQGCGVQPGALHRGEERHAGRLRADVPQQLQQLLPQGLHMGQCEA